MLNPPAADQSPSRKRQSGGRIGYWGFVGHCPAQRDGHWSFGGVSNLAAASLRCGLLMLGAVWSADADLVVLKREIKVEGALAQDDLDGVRVRHESGVETFYPRDEVVRVERQGPPEFVGAEKLRKAGRLDEALATHGRLIADKNDPCLTGDAWLGILKCYQMTGQTEKAIRAYVAMLEANPRTRHFGHAPLITERFQGDDRAMTFLGDVTDRVREGFVAEVSRVLACTVLGVKGHYEEAEKGFGMLLASSDQRVVDLVRIRWAQLLVSQGRWLDALSALKRDVAEFAPALQPEAQYWLGVCYFKQREHRRAAAALLRVPMMCSEAEELAPECTLLAAQAFEQLDQKARAAAAYRELQEACKGTRAGLEAAKRLAAVAKGD